MASSNVEYYQKQKDLQDFILDNEQKRKRLEAQLQAYCQSDEKMAKLRAVKLQSYWRRICEDERRSKQRNAQLLRDLDRMEANMATLDARREKLKHMKEQYFDYIERTYPKWRELVEQKKQEHMNKQQQQQQHQQPQHHGYYSESQQEMNGDTAPQSYEQQKPSTTSTPATPSRTAAKSFSSQGQESRQQTLPKHQEAFLTQPSYEDDEDDEDVPPPLPSSPPPGQESLRDSNKRALTSDLPEREYSNLNNFRRETPSAQPPSVPQSVTVHMPKVQGEVNSPAKSRQDGTGRRMEQPSPNWLAPEKDNSVQSISFSEDAEVPIQPVQSVTVRQKNDVQKKPATMAPVSDDDVSDFEDDPDLPSGAGPEDGRVEPEPTMDTPDEDDDTMSDQPPSPVHPEVTTAGLVRLLKHVEGDLEEALALEGYYRTRSPDEAHRKHIIHKANTSGDLGGLDGELVSMVVLHQLTLVIRRLPGACMLSDTLLVQGKKNMTDADIRRNLHRDAQELWDKLLEHFVILVESHVMGTREVAHIFVPCMVHEGSHYQEIAVAALENVIERLLEKEEGPVSPGRQDSVTLDTAHSSQQGGVIYENLNYAVPPLKFGSLIDSKRFSDDESSMITQSMTTDNGPKVPLNETDAYKSLVSGTLPRHPVHHGDDTDNSDNELEKQIASTLSPRSTGRCASSIGKHNPDPLVPSSGPNEASHDEAHDQEPLSEMSSPLESPVYVPTGAQMGLNKPSTLKSVLGSTGGSSQQRKIAVMISSDLDSDGEVDIDHMVQKKEEEDDDFDFYG
ncbi:centrosomal protein kizuna-like isoform X3 [Dreissena polymorpha]|uniref:centrosomal protein kizuna-like isoform X3 n=1 Tax=Dreissena polymorpha TaxID=45954 RepID=UPI002263EDA4|nr:centrosomal protein kizuna-like isoform X3 [Dreissena polymorpha]